MEITIGRVVHYTLTEADVTLIDAQTPQRDGNDRYLRNPVRAGQTYPALVVATFGPATANLRVLLDGPNADYWATSRTEADDPGQPGRWAWPPRV